MNPNVITVPLNRLRAAGESGSTIYDTVGVSRPTVTLWLDRYEAGGLAALQADRPRSGRPKRITLADEEAIVHRTTQTSPPAGRGTHWSTRLMAEVTGVHHSTIARIWKAHGLRPHRFQSFKLSTDPAFVAKLRATTEAAMIPRSWVAGLLALGIGVGPLQAQTGNLAAAAREIGVDRRTLRRLAQGEAGAAITREVYLTLRSEAQRTDEIAYNQWRADRDRNHDSWDEWFAEETCVTSLLDEAVVGPDAREVITDYRHWLTSQVERYGFSITGSDGDAPILSKKRTRFWTSKEGGDALFRELNFQDAMRDIRHNPSMRRELNDFEEKAKKAGWQSGMARYELAIRNALDPVTCGRKTAIEIDWRELASDEQRVVQYLRVAFQKELMLLARQTDLARANVTVRKGRVSP